MQFRVYIRGPRTAGTQKKLRSELNSDCYNALEVES